MGKSFVSKRSYWGTTVMGAFLRCLYQRIDIAEKHHGRDDQETLRLGLILAATHHAMDDEEKVVPLLTRYVAVAKTQPAPDFRERVWAISLLATALFNLRRIAESMLVASEGKHVSCKIDSSAKDPLLEGFLGLALDLKSDGDSAKAQQGLTAALLSLCYCMTHGCHRTVSGYHLLERLRLFFQPHGIGDEEWEWLVKHARLSKYDFVGLLSILLHHVGLRPRFSPPVVRQGVRVIEVR